MAGEQLLRTLIVDDEPLAVERMQILCAQLGGVALVGTASDGDAALRLIDALSPDLILMDICMPGLDGMAVARAIQGRAHRPAVVFCTAYDAYAVAAFDIPATDYLLKPVSVERLARAVARAGEPVASPGPPAPCEAPRWLEEIWAPHRSEMVRILTARIDLIEAERDYMRLHVGPRSYLIHQTISELERKLDPAVFIRLHRSTIVRRDFISGFRHDGLSTWQALLANGQQVSIGRSHLSAAKALAGR
jgi:two-component system, LytTR family, response regulator AlgR